MKTLRKRHLRLPIVLVFTALANSGLAYDFSELDSVLKSYVDDGRLAGNVLVVVKNGVPIYQQSFGMQNLESARPMKTDTIFRIASQTKALTSVSIMILQERGLLNLNDKLSKYIPAWKNSVVMVTDDNEGITQVPALREITLHDLITHTAGIGYGWGPLQKDYEEANVFGWYFADEDKTVAEILAVLPSLPQVAQPGEKFVYGYNTDLLGVVVERVSGKSLGQFMQEEIIGPLGMTDTSFFLPLEKEHRLASVYNAVDEGIVLAASPGHMEGQGHYVNGPRKSEAGGAGLLSTALDYSRFLQMLARGGELDGIRILMTKTVDKMRSPQIGEVPFSPGNSFGLGFSIVLDPSVAKTSQGKGTYGWGGAYHTTYFIDPENDLTFSYMTQLLPANDLDDTDAITAALYRALGE